MVPQDLPQTYHTETKLEGEPGNFGKLLVGGAVVGGAHPSAACAQRAMTGVQDTPFQPVPARVRAYAKLYRIYCALHDAFGTRDWNGNLHPVMKRLLEIRAKARR